MAMSAAGVSLGLTALVNLAVALGAVVTGHRINAPRPVAAKVGMGLGYFWFVSNIGFALVVTLLGDGIKNLLAQAADWLASDVKKP